MGIIKEILSKLFSIVSVSLNHLAGFCMLAISFFTFYAISWLHLGSYLSIFLLGSFLAILSLLICHLISGWASIKIIRDEDIYKVLMFIIGLR